VNRYSARFLGELFYPMLSIVCTCSYAACAAYPAGVALDYFAKHGVRVGVAPSTGCESEDGRARVSRPCFFVSFFFVVVFFFFFFSFLA